MNGHRAVVTQESVAAHLLVAEMVIKGEPVSKARARFTKYGSKVQTYTPEKTRTAEDVLAVTYRKTARRPPAPAPTAFRVEMEFYNGTRQRRDVDNMVKLVLDGLNRVAWEDDNQVLQIEASKHYVTKAEAHTIIRVYEIGSLNPLTAKCLHCGSDFKTYESWLNDPKGKKYCTIDCAYAARRAARERVCEQCGAPFLATGPMRETKYCSRKCQSEAGRAVVECARCGASMTIQRCHVRPSNYCSSECMLDAQRERRSKRMPGRCEVCGGGTTRKEYRRCNPCKLAGLKPSGKPKPQASAISDAITTPEGHAP